MRSTAFFYLFKKRFLASFAAPVFLEIFFSSGAENQLFYILST